MLIPPVLCRRVRCGWAQHKQNTNTLDHITVDRADPQSCNVYVGNIQDLSDAELRQHFSQFGHVIDVKLYRKGESAELGFCSA